MAESDSAYSSVEGVVEGKTFRVPATISVMRSLFTARCFKSPATLIWLATCLLTEASLVLHYAGGDFMWFFTAQFVFWRLAYNAGIGVMLHSQSTRKSFERMVSGLLKSKKMRTLIEKTVTFRDPKEKPFKVDDYPLSFTAWMVFRFVVNIILANDLLSYFLLVWVHWVPSSASTPVAVWTLMWDAVLSATVFDMMQYAAGLGLIIFGLWSKSDAHRVIGDYAWYWGDFFFLLNQELHFDGIFEMFPHPMYTVGYAFMYGFALLSKSHHVFYWSVFGHMCQIVFLTVVENPHIDKTYKATFTPEEEREAQQQEELLYDEDRGFFEKKELVLLRNFSFTRGADLLLIVCLAYASTTFWLTDSWTTLVVQYGLWRLLLQGVLGWALRQQSLYQAWTHKFGSARRAFDSWKVVYNTVVTTTNFCFLLCGIFEAQLALPEFLTFENEWRTTLVVVGSLLIGVNLWSSLGVYEVIGDYGFFYGDFFIENCPRRLAYSGVYRFLNNPDTVLGCAWYYGIACITFSPRMGALAVVTHACIKLFEVLVEAPHMRRKYGSEIRKEAGTGKALRTRASKVKSDLRRLRSEYERAMKQLRSEAGRATREFEASAKKLTEAKKK